MGKNIENRIRHYNRQLHDIMNCCSEYDFADKSSCIHQHMSYMFIRTQSMFKWDGLPDTIPELYLELFLQTNGNVCFYRHNGNLYVFCGGLGGEPDVYYMPTLYTISNPALKISKTLKIDKDCVVMPNDSLYMGLLPLNKRYATALTENELSIKVAQINSRVTTLISAKDDRTKASAEKYLDDIADGKLAIIGENTFLEDLRTQPYGNTSHSNLLTNLIEMEQYLKASWYNGIGLNANYNMKRESLNSSESQMNNDALLPLVDDMLNCRKKAIVKVNEMFGTNISVDFSSSWKDNMQEIEFEHSNISDKSENDENEV